MGLRGSLGGFGHAQALTTRLESRRPSTDALATHESIAPMNNEPLGRLERLDLRNYWQREDTDFTPWLAMEENIALLGDAIELELEVVGQEKHVGPFRADILCRNTVDNSFVLIENQLERTDHTHLGQLLTYAAGLDAVTLIWIAERFTEEHRAALDWFNRISDDGFHFFGIEMELWRIGSSAPAPRFSLVVKPNDWSKTVREAASSSARTSDLDSLKTDYWTSFADYLREAGSRFRPPIARPWNWHVWGLGRSYFQLVSYVNVRDKRNAVSLYLGGPDAEAHYQLLRAKQDQIEAALGRDLEWEKSSKDRKLILRCDADPSDREDWAQQHEWRHATMKRFDEFFRPIVKELDANDWIGGSEEI